MSYLKRQKVPKNWPIERKGTTYVVSPLGKGIPVLILIRDILKIAKDRAEVKKALREKNILMNNKLVKSDKTAASLFDIVSIIPLKKHYRLGISENGKYKLEEIKETEALKKIAKIINKKTLKGKKTQLNLSDGENFISDIKCKIDDSALINLKERKIENCIPLKEKARVLIFSGKHSGESGIVEKINPEKKSAEISSKNGKINVLIKQIIVTE